MNDGEGELEQLKRENGRLRNRVGELNRELGSVRHELNEVRSTAILQVKALEEKLHTERLSFADKIERIALAFAEGKR